MLVNAHAYPYAAMFQGIGMIGAVIWGLWYTRRAPDKKTEDQKEEIKGLLYNNTKEVLRKEFCPVGWKGLHEWRILGTPRSKMTWYVCDCGARKPRGQGLFYKEEK